MNSEMRNASEQKLNKTDIKITKENFDIKLLSLDVSEKCRYKQQVRILYFYCKENVNGFVPISAVKIPTTHVHNHLQPLVCTV